MAEIFKNFLSKTSSCDVERVIVPAASSNGNTSSISDNANENFGDNFREENSTVQVHSIYVSQVFDTRPQGENRYNEENFRKFDLYIRDIDNPELLIYVAYDIQLVPGCPYYIEKNITLTPSQKLCISLPNDYPNTIGLLNVQVVASAIVFVDDIVE